MRTRLLTCLLLFLAGFLTFSLTRGQSPPLVPGSAGLAALPSPTPPAGVSAHEPQPTATPAPPAAGRGETGQTDTILAQPLTASPAASSGEPAQSSAGRARDLSKLPPLSRQMFLNAQRGADWLYRMNGVKGRFLYGYSPCLNTPLEGDHYLRQIGAARALAQAARLTQEPRYAARATQAVLALLDETTVDPEDAHVRYTALPSLMVNRLAAAGLLVQAINELPAPQADLIERSEELCNYIRRQARPDGSLRCDDASQEKSDETPAQPSPGTAARSPERPDDPDSIAAYPGQALYGLMLSQRHRPAAWKTDLVRKALACYRPWWQAHRGPVFVPAQTAAYAEAYSQTREKPFADFVCEMNDWLCGLQYENIDPRRLMWYGGFRGWADGRPVDSSPNVGSANCAESLAQACRVARTAADVSRHRRYTESLERCLQFLANIQYTDSNIQHFNDWYRPRLLGAFHASHEDGNLRIDYTEHAVSALILYLENAGVQ
jgi:hypothetical protein